MRTTTLRLYSLEYKQAKTYLAVALFVAGNILLPQLCHLVPQGGIRWLPIYFFTLVGGCLNHSCTLKQTAHRLRHRGSYTDNC